MNKLPLSGIIGIANVEVQHFEVENTGFATALPHLLSCVVKICSGPFSDRASCVSETARIKLFTVISQGLS